MRVSNPDRSLVGINILAIRGQVLLRRQGGDDFLKTWIAAQRIPKRIETLKREQKPHK